MYINLFYAGCCGRPLVTACRAQGLGWAGAAPDGWGLPSHHRWGPLWVLMGPAVHLPCCLEGQKGESLGLPCFGVGMCVWGGAFQPLAAGGWPCCCVLAPHTLEVEVVQGSIAAHL